MAITLLDVENAADRALFLGFPETVYRGDPCWTAASGASDGRYLDQAEFLGRQRILLALEDGQPAARLVARLAPRLEDERGRPYGVLGFFEALPNAEVVDALFDAAIAWLRGRGAGEIVGPMDGDTWHRYRLNVGPWEEPPFLMEPYNPAYYPELWTSRGFAVVENYLSQKITNPRGMLERLEPRYEAALEAGYRFEALCLDRFESELRRLYRLSSVVFAENFLYTEISEESFLELYAGVRPLVDPDFVVFALDAEGRDAGFLYAYPDPAAPGTLDLKSMGVLPEHRRSHVGSALMAQAYDTGLAKGYRLFHHCLIKDDNPSRRYEAGLGELLRRYHLYHLPETP